MIQDLSSLMKGADRHLWTIRLKELHRMDHSKAPKTWVIQGPETGSSKALLWGHSKGGRRSFLAGGIIAFRVGFGPGAG